MILSNITVPLLGLVDTAVIGHLPQAYYLAATTIGATIITFVTWLCGFLRMSTTGLTAQASGKEQHTDVILLRGLTIALAIGSLLIVCQVPFIQTGLALSGGSEQVKQYAAEYGYIRVWGLPAALANLVLLGWLLGNHKAKTVLWLLTFTNTMNLLLDLLFVLGFKLGVAGVAWATLISEYSGLIFGLFLANQSRLIQLKAINFRRIWQNAAFADYFRLNRDILIRTLCLELVFVFITFWGARIGDTTVAANAILLNFLLLISFGLDGIANGAEVLVGKAWGQNNHQHLKKVVKVSLFWTGLLALAYSLAFLIFGRYLISLITSIDSVQQLAQQYLIWIVLLPLVACWCYLFDGIYIGVTQAKVMRNSMLISTAVGFFAIWAVLAKLGNLALWIAFLVFMAFRGVTLAWHYQTQLIKPKES